MLRFGTLPPVVLCLLYSTFVLPLFNYRNVVWTPTAAKLTAMIERVHSKFVGRAPPPFHLRFSYEAILCYCTPCMSAAKRTGTQR